MTTATATRRHGYTHDIEVAGHRFVADEPEERGGGDEGPTPVQLLASSLAACTAITVEMYADRKGWDLGELEVCVDFEPGPHQECDSFLVRLRLRGGLTEEQMSRIRTIAGKCPVHRTLAGPAQISITDRVEVA